MAGDYSIEQDKISYAWRFISLKIRKVSLGTYFIENA